MKTLILGLVLSLGFIGTAGAASASQCGTTQVTVGNGTSKTLNVSGKTISVGNGNSFKLNGNNNCLLAGQGNSLKVTGNDNYVKSQSSSVTLSGNHNLFDSLGGNSVHCGGSPANLDITDSGHQCL